MQPSECTTCRIRQCESAAPQTFDVCDYGVSFFNDGTSVKKKTQKVTIRHVASNLRHELNRVIQYIITQAEEIDPKVSVKRIDVNQPASRIVAATMILDRFIEMIAGIYHFSPIPTRSADPIHLQSRVDYFMWTYSLIQNRRRATGLTVEFGIASDIYVSVMPAVTEYLIAVLADNIWKYSTSDSVVYISVSRASTATIDLEFKNLGDRIPQGVDIFERGYQLDEKSEGFGFGLYWATVLCQHYNDMTPRLGGALELTYLQEPRDSKTSLHTFTIKNLAYERK